MDQSEAGRQEPGKESNNKPEKVSQEPTSQKLAEEGSDVPYTQDPNLKDAPSCDKCGQIFPWNQLHRRWKHECPGSAEPHKRVAKSAPLDVKTITLPRPTQSRFTGSPTTYQQEPGKESNHKLENTSREPTNHKPVDGGSDAKDTQDANMKDAPSCEKCGQIFPWNQLHLRWKHKCLGSAESGERVAKSALSFVKGQTLPQSTQSRFTGSPTTSRRAESETEPAATDEDAPRCEKCGRTFPWNQLHLRWKHKCEPKEATHAQDNPQRRTQSSASSIRRPMSVASVEQLLTASTIEVVNETDGAPQVCGCGKTFTGDQGREFERHKLECPEGTSLRPTGTGKHARGTTLPRQ